MSEASYIESNVSQRLDRLPWSRWHWLVVVALGITWVLDGLETSLIGAVSARLSESYALQLTGAEVGIGASVYLTGQVFGALFFGFATDRLGRKKLFYWTLAIYMVGSACTGLSFNFLSFCLFRFIAGMGLGGEYSAINSAIDELIPARLRGRVDLVINSTYWLGAMIGAVGSSLLLSASFIPDTISWRVAFLAGGILGLFILLLRGWVPESPRWLFIHGKAEKAEQTVQDIERTIEREKGSIPAIDDVQMIRIQVRSHTPWSEIWRTLAIEHPKRSMLGLVLMVTQTFLYNAIFFTYGLILHKFYDVPTGDIGVYIFPFALGNLFGPILLGRLFDTIGRKTMISVTYALSGILLTLSAAMFAAGMLNATTQTIAWSIIFFFASSAASSAYLTVSEIFPSEMRGLAIAIFYAVGTLVGGVCGPSIFGAIVDRGDKGEMVQAFVFSGLVMVVAAIVEAVIGVKAEGQSLEAIAPPLSTFKPAADLAGGKAPKTA
jgi:MFS family permease